MRRAGLPRSRQLGLFFAMSLAVVFFAPVAPLAEEFTGQVVGIQDGDTLTVHREGGVEVRIRLWGIDAPERCQAYSNAAKKHLAALAFGQQVRVLGHGQDRYGRIVAEGILPDGTNINQEMVRAGYAWWFRKYAPDNRLLEQLEMEARNARRGLWADPRAVPPWEYRRSKQPPKPRF